MDTAFQPPSQPTSQPTSQPPSQSPRAGSAPAGAGSEIVEGIGEPAAQQIKLRKHEEQEAHEGHEEQEEHEGHEEQEEHEGEAHRHHAPRGVSDRFALGFVLLLRNLADTFFAKRYGHRAIVLETVAAVPGMVGATIKHLKCLRIATIAFCWRLPRLAERRIRVECGRFPPCTRPLSGELLGILRAASR